MIKITYKVKLIGSGKKPLGFQIEEDLLDPQDASSLLAAAGEIAAELRGKHQHSGTRVVTVTTRIDGKVDADLSALGVLTERENAELQRKALAAIAARGAAWCEKVAEKVG